MDLFIAPHDDDETLFGAFTLMRNHPLVVIVTDSWIQFNRGENITADQRWNETVQAMKILECPVIRLGIRDDIIDEKMVEEKLSKFAGFNRVYVPSVQGGNPHHDLISKVATQIFLPVVKQYQTYSKTELYTTGNDEIIPLPQEIEKKEKALACYSSQLYLPATRPHFDAVRGKSEWFL